jgi:hypothetical protein
MYALILDRFGNEETRIVLGDIDTLDPDWYADKYADAMGIELSFDDGVIPDGCEDFSVVITEDPDNSAVCWKSKNYLIVGYA